MAYQALYRRWRPADFTSVVGQETVIGTLRNQVATGRIAHAYLFCGSRGTGKTSAAKILSRAVNCQNPDNGNPCGECASCRSILQDESLDVLEIDAASNNGVDEIRDLRETVKYPPQSGRYKVYIIDEVHMLSTSAFNALLKTLEEPPAHVLFILATTEPQKLPATILSRCQRFDFKRIPAHKIVGRLRYVADNSGAVATDSALNLIARAAEGGMRDALSLLDMCLGYQNEVDEELVRSVLGTSDRSFLFRFAECLRQEDAAGLMRMIDELMRSGREPIVFAKDVSQHLRALLMAKSCPGELDQLLEITKEDAAEYIHQAENFGVTRLVSMMELFMSVETSLRYASSPRIALENAAIRACLRTGEEDNAALTERIAMLEGQVKELTEQLQNGVVVQKTEGKKTASAAAAAPRAEKPKAAPAPVEGNDQAVWKKAMEKLQKTSPGDAGMLSMGKLVDAVEGCFHWEGEDIFVNMFNQEKKQTALAQILSEVKGAPCRFMAHRTGSYRQTEVPGQDDGDAFLAELNATFGAANVMEQSKLNG